MKKLAVFLMAMAISLALVSCGAKPDKALTLSGDAADLAEAV